MLRHDAGVYPPAGGGIINRFHGDCRLTVQAKSGMIKAQLPGKVCNGRSCSCRDNSARRIAERGAGRYEPGVPENRKKKGETAMKVLVLGGVAAGTKAAAKLKREDRACEVTVLTKGKDISYAGCGLPYYVGDVIHEKAS